MRNKSFICLAAACVVVFQLSLINCFASQVRSGMEDTTVHPHSGSANTSYSIAVPQGRGGVAPNITFTYNSNNRNGILGFGWMLEFGCIHVSTKNGVPKYDSTDTFTLVQKGGAQDLIFDSTAGFYRPTTEGAFARIEQTGDSWLITDKQGTKYYFGDSNTTRMFDPARPTHVLRWCLSKVEDIHGNTMTLTYEKQPTGNRNYPVKIEYTSNDLVTPALSPYAQVLFEYETRPDVVTTYLSGFELTMDKRLHKITVNAGGELQRRYDFVYDQNSITGRSLLTSIMQYGADGVTALPATIFTYQDNELNGGIVYAKTEARGAVSSNNKIFSGDFNGDGITDFGRHDPVGKKIYVTLSTVDGFEAETLWHGSLAPGDVFVGKFDGSGKDGIVVYWPNATWKVYKSNGVNGFTYDGTWISGFGFYPSDDPYPVSVGDFNGDGFTDVIAFNRNGGNYVPHVALNNQSGQFIPHTSDDSLVGPLFYQYHPYTADFNGDGLVDFWVHNPTDGEWNIQINNGKKSNWLEPAITVTGFGANRSPVVSDFNLDGRLDIGFYSYSTGIVYYKPATQTGFGEAVRFFPIVFGMKSPSAIISAGDYNGDGLLDYASYYSSGQYEIYTTTGLDQGLLKSTANGIGGATTIAYAPSTSHQSTILPFVIPTVESVTASNSRGSQYTTRYDYADGFWDAGEREFRGFGYVRTIDAENNYVDTHYLQDDITKGRVVDNQAFDAAGNLFSGSMYAWNYEEVIPGVNFIYLERKDNFIYDGDLDTGRRTAEEFFYEEPTQLGNLTRALQLGEVDLNTGTDTPGDSRTVETSYVKNITGGNRLTGLPREMLIKDDSGTVVRKTQFFYDDNPDNLAEPVKGLLTKKVDWAGDAPQDIDLITLYSYDEVGNLILTLDPLQNQTTITYDTGYRLFPLTTVNALQHSVVNEYYGINGVLQDSADGFKGLWGQLKTTSDPNNQQGSRVYDTFGRMTKTIGPLDSLAFSSAISEYNYYTDYATVIARQRINHGVPETVDVITFTDGMGRVLQKKVPSEVPGRYVVSGQTEYDSRGLAVKQYLPRFVTSAFDALDAIDPAVPASIAEYDPMGRAFKTTSPDGTYANVHYNDWTTENYNANGHMQQSEFDAYGRLIEKREYKGADGRFADAYPATTGAVNNHYSLYATTRYVYDSEGNLKNTIDAHGNTTSITYDQLGRKVAMDDPDMGVWSYKYDLNGNLKEQTDAKGQTIAFTYDEINRLKNKSNGGSLNVNYTYDNNATPNSKGRLTQAAYGTDQTDFEYDELGREVRSIKNINAQNHSVERTYDALNKLIQIQYPNQENIHYKYNGAGQIEAISTDPVLFELQSSLTVGRGLWSVVSEFMKEDGGRKREELTFEAFDLVSRDTKYEIPNMRCQIPDTKIEIRNTLHTSRDTNVFTKLFSFLEETILGVGTAHAQSTFPVTLEAENMPTKTTGGATTGGWNIWSNGYVESRVSFPPTGTYEFEIIAKGSYAGGGWPNMELRIEQGAVDSFTVNSSSWTSYKTTIDINDVWPRVAVAFTNDYYVPGVADRNLYVDKIIIREILPQVNTEYHWLETESANSISTPLQLSNDANASEGQFIYSPPGSGDQWDPSTVMADYTVNITNPDNYVLWGRIIASDGGNDSFFVQIDNGVNNLWDTEQGSSWHWDKVSNRNGADPVLFNLSAGQHTIKIKQRETDTRIDKILLTNDMNYIPINVGDSAENINIGSVPLPTINLTVTRDVITEGESATLSWASTDADTCIASDGWTGSKVVSGSEAVNPASTTTYSITCEGVGGISTPSSVTISVNPPIASGGSGNITYEIWEGINTTTGLIADLVNDPGFPANPTRSTTITSFEGWMGWNDYYGSRIHGYIHPPLTGMYTFWISGDDESKLYLSADTDPANKQLIANVPTWSSSREWNKFSEQKSVSISLVAGKKYYIEALQAEGGGGDNLAVAWESTSVPFGVIDGQYLSPFESVLPIPDAQAPTVPTGLVISNITTDSIDLNWNASTDNVGVTGYRIFRDGVEIGTAVTNAYSESGLTPDTAYDYQLSADDAVGNESAMSSVINVATEALPPPPVSGNSANYLQDPDCVGAWLLDETAGSVIDSCGVSNGSASGAMVRGAQAQIDGGVEFYGYNGGNNSVINLGSDASIDNIRTKTVVAWINPHSLGSENNGNILGKNYQDGWIFRLASGNNLELTQAFSGGVARWKTTTGPIQLNAFQHVAVTYEGAGTSSVPKLYVNGVEQLISGNTPYGSYDSDSGYNLLIGISNTTQEFDGVVDEVAIFKRVFTPAEINEVMNGGLAGNVSVSSAPDAQLIVNNVDYNAQGQIIKVEFGNGNVTAYEYDPLNLRLKRIHTIDAGGVDIQDLNYIYDGVGNVLLITDYVNTANQTFTYDEQSRLAEANGDSYGQKTYVYDEIGNIVEKDGNIYSYDGIAGGPHAVTSLSDGTIFTYDANGNMATRQMSDGTLTYYDYDVENRLTKVTKDGAVIGEYKYDGDGGRVSKTAEGVTTTFVGSLYEESGSRSTQYVFLGSMRIANISTVSGLESIVYYHADHLGGTNVMTDHLGEVKELTEYEPFGKFARQEKYGTGDEVAHFYFTNQYRDNETGLYYYGARYYDPSLGRFITPDSIVSRAGIPIMLNRYAYVGNNPIMNTDPSGHFFGFIFAAIKAIVSFAVAHPVIATGIGAAIGGAAGGISAYQNAGNVFQGIAMGAVVGGLSGYTLGLSPGMPGIGAGIGLLKASAAVSLTSQVVDAAGQEAIAQGLRYASMGLSASYVGLNVGIGIKDWATSKLNVTDLAGNSSAFQSGDNIYVNGILSDLDAAKGQAATFNQAGAEITRIAHNSTSGFVADMTESFLQKITFTSSVDRQLANMVKGLNNITFTAHSQGSIITGNALLNLGFSDKRSIVTNSINFSSPLSQPRAYISAAIGGIGKRPIYANNWGDPINLVGPNINPAKFLSGATFQVQNH